MKDIYVKFDGSTELEGDSTDATNAKSIEVSSFKHFVRQPKSSSASSAGGHTAERTEHGEVIFTKDIDRATSKLFRASSAGTVYPKATISFYRAFGGKGSTAANSNSRVLYYQIVLENVVISSVNTEINEGELPIETFGLKYSKIVWEYKTSPIDGTSAVSTGKTGWDLQKNISI